MFTKLNRAITKPVPMTFVRELAPELAKSIDAAWLRTGVKSRDAVSPLQVRRLLDTHDFATFKVVVSNHAEVASRNLVSQAKAGGWTVIAAIAAAGGQYWLALPALFGMGVNATDKAKPTERQKAIVALFQSNSTFQQVVESLKANPGQTAYPFERQLFERCVDLLIQGSVDPTTSREARRASMLAELVNRVGRDAEHLR